MPVDNIGWIKHRGGVSDVSCPDEPTLAFWILFIIKPYVLSAYKVQSAVVGVMRDTERLEKVSKRKSFPSSKQL